MSGFWNTLKTFEISKCYAIICKCHPIFILHSLTKHSNIWCIVTRRMSWFLLLFDKHFSNCLQIPSKYSNTMLSICIPWEKYHMLRTEEDDQMHSLHNEFLLYIFKCKWNREIGHLLTKISNFVQFDNKKHLFQCMVEYNDETMKI